MSHGCELCGGELLGSQSKNGNKRLCLPCRAKRRRVERLRADIKRLPDDALAAIVDVSPGAEDSILAVRDLAPSALMRRDDADEVISAARDALAAAARRGLSPAHGMVAEVPEGFHVRGVSTLYTTDEDGVRHQRSQWVKSSRDHEEQTQALVDAIKSAFADTGRISPIRAPEINNTDLLSAYLIGDAHFGMHSWHRETGESFDLVKAKANLVTAMASLVETSPYSSECMIVQVGDFLHADSFASATPKSGNRLDVDGRLPKVIRAAIKALCELIEMALRKHNTVRVYCLEGNHDPVGSLVLSIALAMRYERERRVIVETEVPSTKFHYHRFGENLIGLTHGDTAKKEQLGPIMAVDRAKDWGDTKYHHWYTGHIHHDSVREFHGVVVESIRTLAPRDAWHHVSGYRSGRDMKCDVIHRQYGRINRHTIGIERIWELQGGQ